MMRRINILVCGLCGAELGVVRVRIYDIGGSFVILGGVKRRCVGMCDVGLLYRFIYFFVDMGKVLHLCCQYKKEHYICTDIFYE